MLLVTTKPGDCPGCPDRRLTQEAEEPPHDKVPNPCETPPYYRRRPSEFCYRFHANESEICSGSNFNHPSLPVLVFQLFFTLVAVILVSNV